MKKKTLGVIVAPLIVLSFMVAGFFALYFMFSENRGHDVAYLQPKSRNEINTTTERQTSKEEVAHKIQTLKMPFIANEGQVDDRVEFYANTLGGTVFVTANGEIVYALPSQTCGKRSRTIQNPQYTAAGIALREEIVGGRVSDVRGERESETNVNYFKGNDPTKWKTNIPTYEMVSLGEVYKGIELKLKAYGNNVEKLFYVKPGAETEAINIRLDGVKALKINKDGQLEARTALGPVKFTKPIAYQEINGKRVEVEVEYKVESLQLKDKDTKCETRNQKSKPFNSKLASTKPNPKSKIANRKLEYGFRVAAYDKTKDLIIDPLLASTFLEGSYIDIGYSLAINSVGYIYTTGFANANFPATPGTYDSSPSGDAFISKLNGDLTSLLASTFLGGGATDQAYSIAINPTSGDVYVTGKAGSGFPTTPGAYDTTHQGNGDCFVSRLNGNLTSLLASTYLGEQFEDSGNSIAISQGGDIYVTGYTYSPLFPTTPGAYQTALFGSGGVFVTKFNDNLTSLIASTFLDGIRHEQGNFITISSVSDIYVAGNTFSNDFPTTVGAYDTTHYSDLNSDAFVSRLNGGLTSLLASTFLGGNSHEDARSVAINSSGDVYITGYSGDSFISGSTFPTTPGAYDTTWNGGRDCFVSKLNGNFTTLLASTFLGSNSSEVGYSLAINSSGDVYVTGESQSSSFPATLGAYDASHNGGTDVFVSKLNSNLTTLLASTFLGGSGNDRGYSLAINSAGDIYTTGLAQSANFPTTPGAYDTVLNYGSFYENVFVSKFDSDLSDSRPKVATEAATDVTSNSATLNGTVNANGLSTTTWFEYDTDSGAPYSYSIAYGSTMSGTSTAPVSIDTGEILSCDTWYYFRIVAQNGTGTAYGSEMSFKTLSCATIIDLASFTAEAGDDGVVTLSWETATEVDNAGFNLYRSRLRDGEYKKINGTLIPAKGGATSGASYHYEDTPPSSGTYYYKLEDVDTNGVSTMHGLEKVRVKK